MDTLEHVLEDLERVYAEWEEAEQRFADETSVYQILGELDETNHAERDYQLLRLRYSPAYFSGHPSYCGERRCARPRRLVVVVDADPTGCA